MLTIFDKSFESNYSAKDKLTYLNGTNQLSTFETNDREVQNVCLRIKVLLGASPTRLEGLALLKNVATQCRSNIFSSNAIYWAKTCVEVLQSSDGCICKDLACNILCMIVSNLGNIPSMRGEVVSHLLPSVIPVLLQNSSEDEWIVGATSCLAVCMHTFPILLAPYKINIEEFLMKHLDTLICKDAVADCIAELPFCEVRGNNSKIFKGIWLQHFSKVLATLHTLLDDFLLDIDDDSQRDNVEYPKDNDTLTLPVLPEDPFACLMLQSRLFCVISQSLAKMLSSNARNFMDTPIEGVIAFVYRILAVQVEDKLNQPSSEVHLIFSLLPEMRCSALTVLESLILSCQSALVQRAEFIGKLFLLSLNISKGSSPFKTSVLRRTAIKVLIVWLKRIGKKGLFEVLKHHEIILQLLDDVTPDELNDYSSLTGKHNVMENGMSNSQLTGREIRDDSIPLLYIEALKALSAFVYIGGSSMDPRLLEEIQKKALFILMRIQYKPVIPAPYCDARCRKKLYGLLLATIVTSNPHLKQSLYTSARIFKMGLEDSSEQVSGVCNKAFTILKPTINPTRASPAVALPSAPKEERPNGHKYLYDDEIARANRIALELAMNGPSKHKFEVPIKFHQSEDHSAMENAQYSPIPESPSGAAYNNEEECNGGDIDQVLQSSSHEDNESVEDESEEDMDEESEGVEELDNGHQTLVEPQDYEPRINSVASHSMLPMVHFAEDVVEQEIDNDDDYEEDEQGSLALKGEMDCVNPNINQNGVYETSEEEEEEAELELDVRALSPQRKRPTENSYESSPKKFHAVVVDQEETETQPCEEAEENATDMIQDFISCSPDESQS